MISFRKYFKYGQSLGLDPYQLIYSYAEETSVTIHDQTIKSQQIGVSQSISGKALHHGRIGTFGTDRIDSKTPKMMGDSILASAQYGKEGRKTDFFSEKATYGVPMTSLPDFSQSDLRETREFGLQIAEEVRQMDARIQSVDVSLSQTIDTTRFANSYGVDVSQDIKVFSGSLFVVCKDEKGELRSGSASFFSFRNIRELYEKSMKARIRAVKAAVDFFGSQACESRTYPIVLDKRCFSTLLSFYIGQLSAKNVQKKVSLFADKIGQKIASDKVTLYNDPLALSLGSSNFDSDGVPTRRFDVIQEGVLKNLFYSLESARIDKVPSNGCSIGNGQGLPQVLKMVPGQIPLDALLEKMGEGLYITDVSGLNSGIDGQTLHFSLPCEGYYVSNGRIVRSISMIVVSGNLKDVLEQVMDCANDIDADDIGSIVTPSVLISSLSVSGK